MDLLDFKSNEYSQFGEDGIIEAIFNIIKPFSWVCVEFGAGDGLDCSNVARLWMHHGWKAHLIEGNPEIHEILEQNTVNKLVRTQCVFVEPTGKTAIDVLLKDVPDIDFMVIDIDGNDHLIWEHMQKRPRVLCVEFNPTVPPHISLKQMYTEARMAFGASLKALIELGEEKGYTFLCATHCNAFFVVDEESESFQQFPRTFPGPEEYTYLVTDFNGNVLAVGKPAPWGLHLDHVSVPLIGANADTLSQDAELTMNLYENKYGGCIKWKNLLFPNIGDPHTVQQMPEGWIPPISAHALLTQYLSEGNSPICIGIAHLSTMEDIEWVKPLAESFGYSHRLSGGVLALIKEGTEL